MWDHIEEGRATDDGRRLYPPVGPASDSLNECRIWLGMMFAVLPEPLPRPDGA
jgi:hypothetical protein